MQTYHATIQVGGTLMIFPSMQAYGMIFLTAMALSIFSVALALFLRRKTAQMSIPNLTR
jgi:hypothetical protein